MEESFESPESALIVSARYDPSTFEMWLTMKSKQGESLYQYAGFPSDLWQEFQAAPSKGQFFSAHIRPLFSGHKVER